MTWNSAADSRRWINASRYLLGQNVLLLLLLLPLLPQELLLLLLHQLGPLVHEHLLHDGCLRLAAEEAGTRATGCGHHAARAWGHRGLHGACGPGQSNGVLLLGGQEHKRMHRFHN